MSEENLETARRGYQHFIATGDILDEVFDPDVVLDMSTFRGWPERQRYDGIDGVRGFLADWLGAWDDFEFELVELREVDDKVVALLRQRGRSREGGVPVEMELAQVVTYRGGKQVYVEMYASHAEGLDAVGLEAP